MNNSRLLSTSLIAFVALAASCNLGCSPVKRSYPHDAGAESACDIECAGSTPYCDTAKKVCVECLTSAECSDESSPACVNGSCVSCTKNTDCSRFSDKAVCKVPEADAGVEVSDAGAGLGSCVQCINNLDCSASKPICDASTNACVQCTSSNDCTSASASVCSKNACVACSANADCSHVTGKGVCSSGVCIKPTATNLSLGDSHSCALLVDGNIKCWGYNGDGELGDGTTNNSLSPIIVSGLSQALKVSAGNWHTCAILSDQTAHCWGENLHGELGNPAYTIGSSLAVPVTGLAQVSSIAASGVVARGSYVAMQTCALLTSGQIKCWGSNQFGELGNGTTTDSASPVTVLNIVQAVEIAGGGTFNCAQMPDGTIQCWGNGESGQLGNGLLTNESTPTAVSYLTGVQGIATGSSHACAISGTSVSCWGNNIYGQIGDGTTTTAQIPVGVPNLSQVAAIAAGSFHTCALLTGGAIQCWGYNAFGQLGNGTTNSGSRVAVVGLTQPAIAIAAGGLHTCAILADHSVVCWGSNTYGQLGTGNNTDSLTPVPVSGL